MAIDLKLNKQMPINLVMNGLSFITNVIIGIWLIPYLVNNIGISAYGMIPLAMVFSQYASIIIQSLNGAINRFLLIALQKEDYFEANKIFNTSLIMISLLVFVQAFIMGYIIFNLSDIINIPIGLKQETFWLFVLTFIGFFLILFQAVLSTPLFAHNRLDILRLINIIKVSSRALIIFLLFTFDEPNLKSVGIANLLSSMIVFVITYYFSRKEVPQLMLNFRKADFDKVPEMAKMSGWILISQVGFLLFLKVDMFLANKFIGTVEAGEYSAIMEWNKILRSMGGIISGIFTPVIMIYYARGEIDKLISMLKVGVKAMGLIMAIPIGIIVALSADIISIWLGSDFVKLELLMIISILPLIFNLAILPLFSVNIAFNKVKIPGIVSLALGVFNFAFALVLILHFKLELYGLVIAGGVALLFKNAIFIPYYASTILNVKTRTFYYYQLTGIFLFIVMFFVTKMFSHIINSKSLNGLIASVIASGLIGIIILMFFIFKDEEFRLLLKPIINKLKK